MLEKWEEREEAEIIQRNMRTKKKYQLFPSETCTETHWDQESKKVKKYREIYKWTLGRVHGVSMAWERETKI